MKIKISINDLLQEAPPLPTSGGDDELGGGSNVSSSADLTARNLKSLKIIQKNIGGEKLDSIDPLKIGLALSLLTDRHVKKLTQAAQGTYQEYASEVNKLVNSEIWGNLLVVGAEIADMAAGAGAVASGMLSKAGVAKIVSGPAAALLGAKALLLGGLALAMPAVWSAENLDDIEKSELDLVLLELYPIMRDLKPKTGEELIKALKSADPNIVIEGRGLTDAELLYLAIYGGAPFDTMTGKLYNYFLGAGPKARQWGQGKTNKELVNDILRRRFNKSVIDGLKLNQSRNLSKLYDEYSDFYEMKHPGDGKRRFSFKSHDKIRIGGGDDPRVPGISYDPRSFVDLELEKLAGSGPSIYGPFDDERVIVDPEAGIDPETGEIETVRMPKKSKYTEVYYHDLIDQLKKEGFEEESEFLARKLSKKNRYAPGLTASTKVDATAIRESKTLNRDKDMKSKMHAKFKISLNEINNSLLNESSLIRVTLNALLDGLSAARNFKQSPASLKSIRGFENALNAGIQISAKLRDSFGKNLSNKNIWDELRNRNPDLEQDLKTVINKYSQAIREGKQFKLGDTTSPKQIALAVEVLTPPDNKPQTLFLGVDKDGVFEIGFSNRGRDAVRAAADARAGKEATEAANKAADEVAEELVAAVEAGSRTERVNSLRGFLSLDNGKVAVFDDPDEALRIGKEISSNGDAPLKDGTPLLTSKNESIAYDQKALDGKSVNRNYLVADGQGGVRRVGEEQFIADLTKYEKSMEKIKLEIDAARRYWESKGRSFPEDVYWFQEFWRRLMIQLRVNSIAGRLGSDASKVQKIFGTLGDIGFAVGKLAMISGNELILQPTTLSLMTKYGAQYPRAAGKGGLYASRGMNGLAWATIGGSILAGIGSVLGDTQGSTEYINKRKKDIAKNKYKKDYDDLGPLDSKAVLFEAIMDLFEENKTLETVFKPPASADVAEDWFSIWQEFGEEFVNTGATKTSISLALVQALSKVVNLPARAFLGVTVSTIKDFRPGGVRKSQARARSQRKKAAAAKDVTGKLRAKLEKELARIPEGDKKHLTTLAVLVAAAKEAKNMDSTGKTQDDEIRKYLNDEVYSRIASTRRKFRPKSFAYKTPEESSSALKAVGININAIINNALKLASGTSKLRGEKGKNPAEKAAVNVMVSDARIKPLEGIAFMLDDETARQVREAAKAIKGRKRDIDGANPYDAAFVAGDKVKKKIDRFREEFEKAQEARQKQIKDFLDIDVSKASIEELEKMLLAFAKGAEASDSDADNAGTAIQNAGTAIQKENKSLDHEYLIRVNPAKLLGELLKGK